jgi:hypothetical protein
MKVIKLDEKLIKLDEHMRISQKVLRKIKSFKKVSEDSRLFHKVSLDPLSL